MDVIYLLLLQSLLVQIFAEREMVFSLRAGPQTLSLRIRRPLNDEPSEESGPWQLRYLGQIQVIWPALTLNGGSLKLDIFTCVIVLNNAVFTNLPKTERHKDMCDI